MKLWACYNIWNEASFIKYSAMSVLPFVDAAIVVDGPYQGIEPDPASISVDGTNDLIRDVAENCPKKPPIILIQRTQPWPDEVTKRNTYLGLVPDGDTLLMMDGDFQLAVPPVAWERMRAKLDDGSVDGFKPRLIEQTPNGTVYDLHWGNPLLFRKVPGMHYAYNHFSLFDGQGRWFYSVPYKLEEDPEYVIYHRSYERSPEENERRIKYYTYGQHELASGTEQLWCPDCKMYVHAQRGEPLACPKCGRGTFFHAPLEDVIAQSQKPRR